MLEIELALAMLGIQVFFPSKTRILTKFPHQWIKKPMSMFT